MKSQLVQSFATVALVLAGCSSTPSKVNTGAIKARTFQFVETIAKPAPAFADNRTHIHPVIQEAITRNLAAKGLTRVASGGDVTVAYLVIIGNNAVTTSLDEYYGYGRDTSALVDKAHEKNTVNDKDPNYFEAGTLVIDIVDSRTHKLLRRNYASRPILQNIPSDVRAENVQKVVDEVLGTLRIEH